MWELGERFWRKFSYQESVKRDLTPQVTQTQTLNLQIPPSPSATGKSLEGFRPMSIPAEGQRHMVSSSLRPSSDDSFADMMIWI